MRPPRIPARMARSGAAVAGGCIVLILMAFALFGPTLARHGPFESDYVRGLSSDHAPVGPSLTFPLGADRLFRDVFARLAYGRATLAFDCGGRQRPRRRARNGSRNRERLVRGNGSADRLAADRRRSLWSPGSGRPRPGSGCSRGYRGHGRVVRAPIRGPSVRHRWLVDAARGRSSRLSFPAARHVRRQCLRPDDARDGVRHHVEFDPGLRRALYRDAGELLCDEAPWAFAYSYHCFHIQQPYVHDVERHAVWPLEVTRAWLDRRGAGMLRAFARPLP